MDKKGYFLIFGDIVGVSFDNFQKVVKAAQAEKYACLWNDLTNIGGNVSQKLFHGYPPALGRIEINKRCPQMQAGLQVCFCGPLPLTVPGMRWKVRRSPAQALLDL